MILSRKKSLFEHDRAAAASEVEEAELAVKLAVAQIALAELEHDQKGYDAQKQMVKIEQMQITSPIDGSWKRSTSVKGKWLTRKTGKVRSWSANGIRCGWNCICPSSQASQLKLNEELPVKYDGGQWQTAKIIFFEKVDAASDTDMVRLELVEPFEHDSGFAYAGKIARARDGCSGWQYKNSDDFKLELRTMAQE